MDRKDFGKMKNKSMFFNQLKDKFSKHKVLYSGILIVLPILTVAVAMALPISIPKNETMEIEGTVEINGVPVFTQVSGTVLSLSMDLGQRISQGDILATIDTTDALYAIEQLKATLEMKKSNLRGLEKTTSKEQTITANNNINIQRQNLNSATALLNKSRDNYNRLKTLYDEGAVPKVELDNALFEMESNQRNVSVAQSALSNAEQQLSSLTTDNTEKIVSAKADISQTESQIAQAEKMLEKYEIYAMNDGIVIARTIDVGGMATAGSKLGEISKENEKMFVFYLPEEYVSRIAYGDKILVKSKGTNKEKVKTYEGKVNFIDLNAQYTPKESESSANKNKLSFKVKVLLPLDCDLRAAEKALVII